MPVVLLTLIFFGFVFTACFLAVVIASRWLVLPGTGELLAGPALFREETLSSISPLARILEKLDVVDRLEHILDQANVDWSPGRVVMMMLLAAALGAVAISDMPIAGGLPMLIAAAGAGSLPLLYVLRLRRKRMLRFEIEFADALDSLCRALRAGHPFAAGIEQIAAESSGPVAAEMRKTIEEWRLGASWDAALENLSKRVPLMDVRVFAAAVRLQMRAGGRLGEVLGRVSESMRENVAMRGEVRALAAHGRASGMVLTLLPVGLAILMFSVNREQMFLLVHHPLGGILITTAIVMLILAHFVIQKIVDIRQ